MQTLPRVLLVWIACLVMGHAHRVQNTSFFTLVQMSIHTYTRTSSTSLIPICLSQTGNRIAAAGHPRSSARTRAQSGAKGSSWKGVVLSPLCDSVADVADVDNAAPHITEGGDGGDGGLEVRDRSRSLALKEEVPFLSGFGMGGSVSTSAQGTLIKGFHFRFPTS